MIYILLNFFAHIADSMQELLAKRKAHLISLLASIKTYISSEMLSNTH
jgi:hypothetical protein